MAESTTKVFISYASEDKTAFVQRLHEALKDKFEVWFDDRSLLVGESIPFGISDGIKACDWAVVVLSQNYIRKKWTKEEFEMLLTLEKSDRKIIIPILGHVTK